MPDKCVSHSYTDLIKRLRAYIPVEGQEGIAFRDRLMKQAAEAIENLERSNKGMFERLAPSLEYVEGTAVGYGEDEIDRLEERLSRHAGPLVPFERAVIDAAMARLERWHKDEPGGLLPADHPRGLTGTARDLVVACLALEKARLGATPSPIEKEKP